MNNLKYYNYIYLDPRKPGKFKYPNVNITFLFEPFYVGKGVKNRMYRHLWKSCQVNDTNIIKKAKINKILNLGFNLKKHILKLETNLCHNDALKNETFFILNIGQLINKTGPLTNILIKGGKSSSLKLSKLRSKKQSLSWTDKRKRIHSKRMKELYHMQNSLLKKGLRSPHDNNGKQISITRKKRFETGKINRPMGANNPNCKTWIITDPKGKKYKMTGTIEIFCQQNNLSPYTMREMSKNRYPKPDWNGWKCESLGFANHKSVI